MNIKKRAANKLPAFFMYNKKEALESLLACKTFSLLLQQFNGLKTVKLNKVNSFG